MEPIPLIGVGEHLIWWVGNERKKEERPTGEISRKRKKKRKKFVREKKKEPEKKKRKKEKGRKAPIKLRSRVICGSIELKFCQRVSGSMFFNLIG